jgi:hypothetical protein
VRIKAVLAPVGTPEGQVAYPEETARLSKVEAGKKEEFKVRLSSSPLPVADEGPAPYEFRLWVNSNAGLLRWSRWFFRASPPVAVWKPIDWTRPRLDPGPAGKCSFSGLLYSGQDQRLRAIVSVPSPSAIINSLVTSFDRVPYEKGVIQPLSRKGALQEIDLPEVKAFRPRSHDYQITVQSDELDRAACAEMLGPGRLTVHFVSKTGGQP